MSDLSTLTGKMEQGGKEAPDEAGHPDSHKAVPSSLLTVGIFTNNLVVQILDSEKTGSWTLGKMYPPLYIHIHNVTFSDMSL